MMYIYLILVNVIAFWLMHHDKEAAKAGKWRTPERRLWLFAIIGGACGIWAGMVQFRHKTKHPSFQVGVPLLVLADIFIIARYFI
ncbi:DUF1294 domain-containing protein [Fictibacillus sp. KU28468]|uniref:DUF1294 domain-containing protein n=1 Tax=Fictibacillus sp. KU28468 TaxID=2991053 RepID=UPI00223D494D|nr:DUF1294 domain-containing protein [Fictibacillus sp. KU28468]UZJ80345.1 DUF1294 domain-containing protein [Fictibacillus sp. KU28468]